MSTQNQAASFDRARKSAADRVSVWALLNVSGGFVGDAVAIFPRDAMGTLRLSVSLVGQPTQYGSASGYGVDKVSAALNRMVIKGVKMDCAHLNGLQGLGVALNLMAVRIL